MKKLFVLAALFLLPFAGFAVAAPKPSSKPAPKPAPKAVPVAPAPAPKPAKPGFWERTWVTTKSGTQKVLSATSRVVTSPFRGKSSKDSDAKAGWRQLAVSITADPATVKLPETRSVRVKIAVVNRGKYAAQLDFPSTERIAVVVRDDHGNVRSIASDEQKGNPEQSFLVINPEERLEYSATISTRDLSAGQSYTIQASFPAFPELHALHTFVPVR